MKSKLTTAISEIPVNSLSEIVSDGTTSFNEMSVVWLNHVRPQIKESSYNKYQNILESYILPAFGDAPLSSMTHGFIDAQCNALLQTGGCHGTGLSPKTVCDTLSVIRRILGYAIQLEKAVPCDGRSVTIKHKSKPMRVLSRNEQEKLCGFLLSHPSCCNLGILLSLFTGLRVGEICALQWEDISLQEQTLFVHQTMQRVQNKGATGKKTRIVITSPKSECSIRVIPIQPCSEPPNSVIRFLVLSLIRNFRGRKFNRYHIFF